MRGISPQAESQAARIGAKLRAARRAQGLTLAEVASGTGLSKGYLSRVERDETSPSVATLHALCQVLSVTIGSLFDQPDTAVVHLDSAPHINLGGFGAREQLVTPRGQSAVQVIHSTIEAGADGGDELYTINCDVEVLHIISGELELRFSTSSTRLKPGDTVTFHGDEPHSWHCDEATRVIWILVPAPWSSRR
jgi:transcriptional regulator with XRE-family HTH domain